MVELIRVLVLFKGCKSMCNLKKNNSWIFLHNCNLNLAVQSKSMQHLLNCRLSFCRSAKFSEVFHKLAIHSVWMRPQHLKHIVYKCQKWHVIISGKPDNSENNCRICILQHLKLAENWSSDCFFWGMCISKWNTKNEIRFCPSRTWWIVGNWALLTKWRHIWMAVWS